jgi:hypothetical protein
MKKLWIFLIAVICFGVCAKAQIKNSGSNINVPLTKKSMVEVISSKLPERGGLDAEQQAELFNELKDLNIITTKEFRNILIRNLCSVLEEEEEICKEMLLDYEERGGDFEIGDGLNGRGYWAEIERLEAIKKGQFFVQIGLVRTILVFEFGEYGDYGEYEEGYFED